MTTISITPHPVTHTLDALSSPTSLNSPSATMSPPNTLLPFNTARNESLMLPQFNDRAGSFGDLNFDFRTDSLNQSYSLTTFDAYNTQAQHTKHHDGMADSSIFDEKVSTFDNIHGSDKHDMVPGSMGMPASPQSNHTIITVSPSNSNNTSKPYEHEEKQADTYTPPSMPASQQGPTIQPYVSTIQPRTHIGIDDVASSGTRSEVSYDSEMDSRHMQHSVGTGEEELDIDFDLELDQHKLYSQQQRTHSHSYQQQHTAPPQSQQQQHHTASYHASKTVPTSPRRAAPPANDWHNAPQPHMPVQQQYSRTPTQHGASRSSNSTHYLNGSMTMPTNSHTPHRMHPSATPNQSRANLFSPAAPQHDSTYSPHDVPHRSQSMHPLSHMHPNGMFSAPVSPRSSQYPTPATAHYPSYNGVDKATIPQQPLQIDENDDSVVVGRYTKAERRRKIIRFQEKKQRRTWHKKILYACRKTFADKRPRVGGRFVKMLLLPTGERVPADSPEGMAFAAQQAKDKASS